MKKFFQCVIPSHSFYNYKYQLKYKLIPTTFEKKGFFNFSGPMFGLGNPCTKLTASPGTESTKSFKVLYS